jgi:hypothetical protein
MSPEERDAIEGMAFALDYVADLRTVWKAVEWRCSSDIGDAELEREAQRYCREVESDD